jgi:hypothetical protein
MTMGKQGSVSCWHCASESTKKRILKERGLERIEDLLSDEQQAQLTKDLQQMAFQRRASEAAAAHIVMH